MAQEHERRSFFRIRDRLVVEFRQISPEDFLILKDIIRYNSAQASERTGERYFPADKALGKESNEILAYMNKIDKKLDAIVDLLTKAPCGEKYQSVRTELSLSGAGVRFESDAVLFPGDYTELRITVPVFPYPKITILCEVVRTESVRGSGMGISNIAMKYLVINERDRDFLINYIFEKEREHLRQKRET